MPERDRIRPTPDVLREIRRKREALMAAAAKFALMGPERALYRRGGELVTWQQVPENRKPAMLRAYLRSDGWSIVAWPETVRLVEDHCPDWWLGYLGITEWPPLTGYQWPIVLKYRGRWAEIGRIGSRGLVVGTTMKELYRALLGGLSL